MLGDMINRPCTVHVRADDGERDEHNNPVRNDSTRETVCELQQRSRSELSGQTEVSATEWVAFFHAGEELDRAFQLEVDGQIFEFDGAPWPAWNSRTQKIAHIEASLTLVEADAEEVDGGS